MTRSRYVLPLVSAMLAGAAMLAPSQAQAQQPPAPAAGGAAAGGTDHAQVSGTFGVGYLGLGGITIGQLNGQAFGARTIDAPIIGVRYWLSESFGIDAGVGVGIESGKVTNKNGSTTVETEKPAATGFLLHAGVPLVLGTPGQHHTFQVVPELNVGFGSSTIKGQTVNGVTSPDTNLGGFRLDIGARAGTEIQFGFMGLPKLALQATVGLYFTTTNVTAKQDQLELTDSNTRIGTTVQAPPWAIFTNNISALYYF
jgi:hypothetical protein